MDDKIRAAQEHYARGNRLDAAGDEARAIGEWETAVRLNSKFFDAHYNLGIAYADAGDLDRAVEELDLAHRLDPDDADARRELADVLNERAETYDAADDETRAIADWARVLELDPQNETAHFNLGLTFADQRDYAGAEEHLRAAISANPFDPDTYVELADVYLEQDRHDEAIRILRDGLYSQGSLPQRAMRYVDLVMGPTTPPQSENPRIDVTTLARKLAELELERGQLEQALAALEQAALAKDNADLWYQVGEQYAARGDYENARLALNRAVELDPDHSAARALIEKYGLAGDAMEVSKTGTAEEHAARGDDLYAQGKVDEAQKEWQTALELDPNHLTAHYNLGSSYQEDEDFDLAEKEYREVLRISADDEDAHRGLAEIYTERSDWENAIREYREVLRLAPQDDDARRELAAVLIETTSLAEAQAELDQIEDETPEDGEIWADLGDAYEARGARADAVEAYKNALILNPNIGDARVGLKRLAPRELKNVPASNLRRLIPFVAIGAVLLAVAGLALYTQTPGPKFWAPYFERRVVLQADKPLSAVELAKSAEVFKDRLQNVNVTANKIGTQAPDRIIVHLAQNAQVSASVWETSAGGHSLEFVELGDAPLDAGTIIETSGEGTVVGAGTPTPVISATNASGVKVYRTVLTGSAFRAAAAGTISGMPVIQFQMTDEGAKFLEEYTAAHIGTYLAIVIDKKVVSAPLIQSEITGGQGMISGQFTVEEARAIVVQLNSGQLPTNFKVVSDSSNVLVWWPE